MSRRTKVIADAAGRIWLAVAVFTTVAGCGGGGGGGGSAVTPTPTFGRNAVTKTNENGSTTIAADEVQINGGEITGFRVFLRDASGKGLAGEEVRIATGAGLMVVSPAGGTGRTGTSGVLAGELMGVSGGTFSVQAIPTSATKGLPVAILNISVYAPSAITPTGTGGLPGPTLTPTAAPVDDVARIIVQASPFSISSAAGGTLAVTIFAFDIDNVGVPGVRLLIDASPRVGTSFSPQTPTTNANGQASSVMTIEPGAAVGQIVIYAVAGSVQGQVPITVVSGVSRKPVATVVLESDQPTIGSDSGGTASLKARVFDADNVGIPDVNVLFMTEVGFVSPAVEVSCGGTGNPCSNTGLAQTTLTVPPNAIIKEYNLKAIAGGVSGTTTISVIAGRGGTGTGNPNAAPGEPASISLGASPTRVQAKGTGGTEQATIITRVFDNNNNPLAGKVVALRVTADSATGARMLPLSGDQPAPPAKCMEDAGRAAAYAAGRMAVGTTDRAGFILAAMLAGTVKGTVTIEACADSMNADGETVSTVVDMQPLVVVAAGPPASVSVAVNTGFIDNNTGTLLTTVTALVKDSNGNAVEDGTAVFFEITNRDDVSIIGGAGINQLPPCDVSPFPQQTGIPVTAQPGTAVTCMIYPLRQAGTVVRIRAESGGVTNEDNSVQDEEFNLPPGATTGPATGVPSARGFSLATQYLNMSGRVTFGLTSVLTAFVTDRFGNPASSNTLVRFTTDGGGVTSQNTTSLIGRTTATLQTQYPIPGDGLVTVAATVEGEEAFTDVDGDGEYAPEIDEFDPITDDQDGDGVWSSDTTIAARVRVLFSGPTRISVSPSGTFGIVRGMPTCFSVHVSDDLDNPIVAGSTVRIDVSENLKVLGAGSYGVPDAAARCDEVPSACNFPFCVYSTEAVTVDTAAGVAFFVESDDLPGGGNGDVALSVGGLILAPTPTPVPTSTPVPTNTSVPTSTPPPTDTPTTVPPPATPTPTEAPAS